MVKRVLVGIIIGSLLLTGCSSSQSSSESSTVAHFETIPSDDQNASAETGLSTSGAGSESTETVSIEGNDSNLDFDGSGLSNMGDGTFVLSYISGTTENGDALVVYYDPDNMLIQLGYSTRGINGSLLSYIFIDGMQKMSQQLGDSDGSIDVSGDDLSIGTHKVELVQFENNEIGGNVTTYKSASYEVVEQ